MHGVFTFGSFIAFYLYASRFYSPIQSLANRGVEIYNGLASAQRIAEYLDLRSTVAEPAHPVHLDRVNGEIAFEQVSFRYPGAKVEALSNFNIRIAAGEKIAVVGPSGAGKTTMITLLCRLHDPDVGTILLDGHDLRSLSLRSLRESVGVVSQEALLFHDTILENIRFGRPDATNSEIISAAKAAHLHEFVESLPSGYSTVIGAKGMKLSGGQKQRLSLARVILKNAKIWVLDEFTSSLDSGTETVIYENIAPLLCDKTAITIAHRLSTVVSADRIMVVDRGQLLESGTHHMLFRSSGLYATLFEAQMQASQPFREKAPVGLG
jgi:ATP-binding cassette subfamily B protein